MTPERTQAYRRVLCTLADLGPSKLQPAEQEQIRYAADSLIFCRDLRGDDATQLSLVDTELLLECLVDSGRWERATAERLAGDICACGPDAHAIAFAHAA